MSSGLLDGSGGQKSVATLARDAQVATLPLTHIAEHVDRAGSRERGIIDLSTIFNGNMGLGEELMTLKLSSIGPGNPV